MSTKSDYRKCYVELSQCRGRAAAKLKVSCWHAAETVFKYFVELSDSGQGQAVDKWCWRLINTETNVVAGPISQTQQHCPNSTKVQFQVKGFVSGGL